MKRKIPTKKEFALMIRTCSLTNVDCDISFISVDKKGRERICSNCELAQKKKNGEYL